jgi:Flp pilus assembly protein TadD
MALVAEAAGNLGPAVRWARAATSRDTRDWAAWYVAARIERKAGNLRDAREAFRKAKALNVRSPLFASAGLP